MLRQLIGGCLGLAIACLSSTAFAQSERGVALGLRLGYAIPMGRVGAVPLASGGTGDTAEVHDLVKGMIPIWLDAGYRINPALFLGAFFQYGFGVVNKDSAQAAICNQGASCSAHDISFGANLHYHLLPDRPFDPWVGAGLGYEFLTVGETGSVAILGQRLNVDGSSTLKGFQFLVLEVGGDFKAAPALAVGPFVNFALGKYTSWSSSNTVNGTHTDGDGDLQNTGLHEWFTFGLRGQYNL